jgi:hypothetical protein
MGVEIAIAVVSLAVTAAAAYEQSQAASSAAKDRKKAAQISQAEQAAQAQQSRRSQVREERVRRATILQSSQNTGVSQSSGELGASSALGSLISGNLAGAARQQNSSTGIGAANQSAANADIQGAQWGAIGNFAGSVFGMAASAATKSGGTTQVQPTTAAPQSSVQASRY